MQRSSAQFWTDLPGTSSFTRAEWRIFGANRIFYLVLKIVRRRNLRLDKRWDLPIVHPREIFFVSYADPGAFSYCPIVFCKGNENRWLNFCSLVSCLIMGLRATYAFSAVFFKMRTHLWKLQIQRYSTVRIVHIMPHPSFQKTRENAQDFAMGSPELSHFIQATDAIGPCPFKDSCNEVFPEHIYLSKTLPPRTRLWERKISQQLSDYRIRIKNNSLNILERLRSPIKIGCDFRKLQQCSPFWKYIDVQGYKS